MSPIGLLKWWQAKERWRGTCLRGFPVIISISTTCKSTTSLRVLECSLNSSANSAAALYSGVPNVNILRRPISFCKWLLLLLMGKVDQRFLDSFRIFGQLSLTDFQFGCQRRCFSVFENETTNHCRDLLLWCCETGSEFKSKQFNLSWAHHTVEDYIEADSWYAVWWSSARDMIRCDSLSSCDYFSLTKNSCSVWVFSGVLFSDFLSTPLNELGDEYIADRHDSFFDTFLQRFSHESVFRAIEI